MAAQNYTKHYNSNNNHLGSINNNSTPINFTKNNYFNPNNNYTINNTPVNTNSSNNPQSSNTLNNSVNNYNATPTHYNPNNNYIAALTNNDSINTTTTNHLTNYQSPNLNDNTLNSTNTQYVTKIQPLPKNQIRVEIKGRITDHRHAGKAQQMKIFAANENKEYPCYCPPNIFAPMRQGDAVIAVCSAEQTNQGLSLTILEPPFVIIGTDRDTMMQQILRFLNKTGKSAWHAQQIYNSIASKINNFQIENSKSTDVNSFLDDLSIRHCRYGDETARAHLTDIVGENVAGLFLSRWFAQRALRRLYLLGLNRKEIKLISKRLKIESIHDRALQNPYTLYEITLEKAVEMCRRFRLQVDQRSPGCGQLIRYVYKKMEDNADIGTKVTRIRNLFPWFDLHRVYLIENFPVIIEHYTVYLQYPALVERRVANMIRTQLSYTPRPVELEMIRFRSSTCTQEQKGAVLMALQQPVSIITGEGGTGKTTITNEIIQACKDLELTFLAVSFTGAAVVRMRTALNGETAFTMDRAIAKAQTWKTTFQTLIVDEVSMVSTELVFRFISAFKFPFYVVFIGHKDQLQPISWGNFFQEIYKHTIIKRCILTQNFRTIAPNGQRNMILHNARKILEFNPDPEGDCEEFHFQVGGNFHFLNGDEQTVIELITTMRTAGISVKDIKVICPYKEYVKQLNVSCQAIWTGDNISLTDKFGSKWALNDLVYMTVNDYEINVMNGEQGEIVDLNDKEIFVEFSSGTHKFDGFPVNDPDNSIWNDEGTDNLEADPTTTKVLKLAYASTIHIAQGGEHNYGIVFFPAHNSNARFLDKTLVYVAISRFKKLCYCVGDRETVERAAMRPSKPRVDNLNTRLIDENYNEEEYLIADKSVDPLKFKPPIIRPKINNRALEQLNSRVASSSASSSSMASSSIDSSS